MSDRSCSWDKFLGYEHRPQLHSPIPHRPVILVRTNRTSTRVPGQDLPFLPQLPLVPGGRLLSSAPATLLLDDRCSFFPSNGWRDTLLLYDTLLLHEQPTNPKNTDHFTPSE